MSRSVRIEVDGPYVKKYGQVAGVKGEGFATVMYIEMDEAWRPYSKRIVWHDAQGMNPVRITLYNSVADLVGGKDPLNFETKIPSEPLTVPGWCSFIIEGYDEESGAIALTATEQLQVLPGDKAEGEDIPGEITPDEAQQLQTQIDRITDDVAALVDGIVDAALDAEEGAVIARVGAETAQNRAQESADAAASSAESASESALAALQEAQTAEGAKSAAEDAAERAESNALHPPIIDAATGNWALWDISAGAYVVTQYPSEGPQGIQGKTGPQGIQGIRGEKGDKGDTGATGATGPVGPKGEKGDKGDTGEQGIQGVQGIQGPVGPQGEKGDPGTYTLTEQDKEYIAGLVAFVQADEPADAPENSLWVDVDEEALYISRAEGVEF